MNKKLIIALTSLILIVPTASHAALKSSTVATPTLAILDTALDSTIPQFQGKIAHEVCIIKWKSCPNGKEFMEGPGSASLPMKLLSSRNFNHGTQMVAAALEANPNMQIVFVRTIGNTIMGDRQSPGPSEISKALEWVVANKDRFNIKAVAMAAGHHNLLSKAVDYCPNNIEVTKSIEKLSLSGIAPFFASGNNGDKNRLDWPSCVANAISVGAVNTQGEIEFYSNNDNKRLTFLAPGTSKIIYPGGSSGYGIGTSVSTQIAAAHFVALTQAKPNLTYNQYLSILISTSSPAKSNGVLLNKIVNIKAAIGG
jgi:subtilisin family serine protease